MQLHTLLRQLSPRPSLVGVPNPVITGVQDDSRLVEPGNLFVACRGTKVDGSGFIANAASRGAAACVTASPAGGCSIAQIVVQNPNVALSVLAHAFHGNPTDKLRVLGVTGTNGKTTVAYLVRHLLNSHKLRCGMIGTVEVDDGKTRREADMTTPKAVDVANLFAAMRDKGCRAAAIETSSHALDQGRVAAVRYAGAAFTNLTGDHLDYHKTMDAYAAAKAQLFTMLPPDAVAVINAGDKWSDRMIQDCAARIIRFGFGKHVDYRARDVKVTSNGCTFTLITPDGKADVATPLIGEHNVENALAAAAMAGETFHLTAAQIAKGLRDAAGAPGRLQAVNVGQPFATLVDYAHTDDALENVLTAVRPLCRGTLRVLFGCGGDRDATKRPRMAKVAERLADAVYVTSDNPRTESPQKILDDIGRGFTSRGVKPIIIEPDRRTAIQRALADAQPGDVVLLAGKGHENYQILGTEKLPFDDVREAEAALRSRAAA